MYLSSATLRFVLSATLLAAGGCLSFGAQEAFLAAVAPAGSSHLSLASAADSVIVFSEGQCTDVSPQRNAVTTGTSRPSTAFSADLPAMSRLSLARA